MICFLDSGPPTVAGVCANAMPVQATIAKANVKGFIGKSFLGCVWIQTLLSRKAAAILRS